MKLIIVGSGWAGVASAYEASKLGIEVTLIERTDMILGTGLVGGIMRNNGRFTAIEELKEMGIIELIDVIDNNCTHKNINFPGHNHASLYDVTKIEEEIKRLLKKLNVNIVLNTRISKIKLENKKILYVESDKGDIFEGDIFIDSTGTAGPMSNCMTYGNGCAMCALRCPTFKGRVSLTELCEVKEIQGKRIDGSIGSMSGSCKILKESLSKEINDKLNEDGVVIIPLKNEFIENHLDFKACQQYAIDEFKDNLILLDTGHAKLMTPYYELDKLRRVEGFENAKYIDPYSGGIGNSMRFFAIAPHENSLKVKDIDNLLCAGEKAGLVGHTEAIMTGVLAGYNALKLYNKEKLLEMPRTTVIGEAIAFTNEQLRTKEGLSKRYTVSGSILFDRIKELNLYTTDINLIKKRIKELNLSL